MSPAGSSPRVRGTAARTSAKEQPKRFIPACAGNRQIRWRRPAALPVHPRVCGEQIFRCRLRGRFVGSSPRVRGTALALDVAFLRGRFIPACAGNRPTTRGQLASRPVHPRVCGEQAMSGVVSVEAVGSSPRVRGTAPAPCLARSMRRFIPACAGNSGTVWGCPTRWPVHPRVCGEQPVRGRKRWSFCGSSPRVRGTATDRLG